MNIGGENTRVHCPKCDAYLVWWEYANSESQSDLGMGCENSKCDGYEVYPENVYDAITDEEERLGL